MFVQLTVKDFASLVQFVRKFLFNVKNVINHF